MHRPKKCRHIQTFPKKARQAERDGKPSLKDPHQFVWTIERINEDRTYRFFSWKGGVIAYNIVDRNANGESNTSVNELSVNLLGVKFPSLGFHHGMSELTKVQHRGSRNTLSNQTFQGQVDDFRCLLVLSANVTEESFNRDTMEGKST